jgi:hypothetical protein
MRFQLPEVSKEAQDFILSAMAFEPDCRPDAQTLLSHSWLQGEESSVRSLLRFSNFDIPLNGALFLAGREPSARLKQVIAQVFSDVGIYCYEFAAERHSSEFLRDRKPVFCQACISSEYYLKFFTFFTYETPNGISRGNICFELIRGRSILFLKVVHKLKELILAALN